MRLYNIQLPIDTFSLIYNDAQTFIVFYNDTQTIKPNDLVKFFSGNDSILVQIKQVIIDEEWLVSGNTFLSFRILK